MYYAPRLLSTGPTGSVCHTLHVHTHDTAHARSALSLPSLYAALGLAAQRRVSQAACACSQMIRMLTDKLANSLALHASFRHT
eukprot:6179845-Pleurochrysis_carterae.AAC.1